MSKLFRYSLFLFILLGLPFMALPVLTHALALPVPAVISTVFTVLYLGILIAVVRKTRLWPYQGWAPALLAVLWGAGTSYALVSVSAPSIIDLAAHTGATTTVASWGGAYPEEIAKATGVVFILLAFKQLNRPWHGFVIGMLVGLGFESFENLLYGIVMSPIHPSSDIMGVLQIWGARVFLGPFLHIAFTGLAGWGIGWALFAADRTHGWRLTHALGWPWPSPATSAGIFLATTSCCSSAARSSPESYCMRRLSTSGWPPTKRPNPTTSCIRRSASYRISNRLTSYCWPN